ncbi:unnamed protein product [Moneuplotes crassus]|uniref:Uncharacterized protein n=1 Tax=Euplotes crassus TaxID=5936 RepID=A0AAD1UAY4_EUPCR|nr:unnamed protein product [Moneuplotes crassus]
MSLTDTPRIMNNQWIIRNIAIVEKNEIDFKSINIHVGIKAASIAYALKYSSKNFMYAVTVDNCDIAKINVQKNIQNLQIIFAQSQHMISSSYCKLKFVLCLKKHDQYLKLLSCIDGQVCPDNRQRRSKENSNGCIHYSCTLYSCRNCDHTNS